MLAERLVWVFNSQAPEYALQESFVGMFHLKTIQQLKGFPGPLFLLGKQKVGMAIECFESCINLRPDQVRLVDAHLQVVRQVEVKLRALKKEAPLVQLVRKNTIPKAQKIL